MQRGEEELEKPPLGWAVMLLVFLMGCLPTAPRVVRASDLTPPPAPPPGQRSSHSSVSQTRILSEMHQKSPYVFSWAGLTSGARSLWSAGYTLCRMLPRCGTLASQRDGDAGTQPTLLQAARCQPALCFWLQDPDGGRATGHPPLPRRRTGEPGRLAGGGGSHPMTPWVLGRGAGPRGWKAQDGWLP